MKVYQDLNATIPAKDGDTVAFCSCMTEEEARALWLSPIDTVLAQTQTGARLDPSWGKS